MNLISLLVLGWPLQSASPIAAKAPPPAPMPLPITAPVADKNFPFLAIIERNAAIRDVVARDPELRAIGIAKRRRLSDLATTLDFGKVDELATLEFSADEIAHVSTRLEFLTNGPLRPLAQRLRMAGTSQRYSGLTDASLVVQAWLDAARGMNRIIEVYGTQKEPSRSVAIDAPIYTPKLPLYGGLLRTALGVELETVPAEPLFFVPNRNVAVRMLEIQLRDEAGRHEPMEQGVNLAAYRKVRRTNFARFTYSMLLVPGFGPEEEGVRLSPIGKLGIELAARRYRAGLAPFILVSGGYVHPNRTPYSEAIEMRESLVRDFGIPADAILVDPHARHTTTNLRNAARIIFRYGMPFDKPALMVTNEYQSRDVASPAFFARCQSVFGFQPATEYVRKSPFDLSFRPALDSLTVDPLDPLDP